MKFRLKSNQPQQIMGKLVKPGDILEGDQYKPLLDIGVLEIVPENVKVVSQPVNMDVSVVSAPSVDSSQSEVGENKTREVKKKKKKGLFKRESDG